MRIFLKRINSNDDDISMTVFDSDMTGFFSHVHLCLSLSLSLSLSQASRSSPPSMR
jgi:hypothetical protein